MSTATLQVVHLGPDGEVRSTSGTIRLRRGRIVCSPRRVAVLLNRFRLDGTPDAEIFALLLDGGWSNGYVAIRPALSTV